MKEKKIMELVMILDESGSMYGMEKDVIGGYNRLLEENKNGEYEVYVTTVTFSNNYRIVVDREKIADVKPLGANDYRPDGCTALLDTVGDIVGHISTIHRYLPEDAKVDKTVVAITTDGEENSSHRYTYQEISKLLKTKQKEGWEVLFLAANIDAEAAARKYGIDAEKSVNYSNTPDGYMRMMKGISKAVKNLMSEDSVGDWKDEI